MDENRGNLATHRIESRVRRFGRRDVFHRSQGVDAGADAGTDGGSSGLPPRPVLVNACDLISDAEFSDFVWAGRR